MNWTLYCPVCDFEKAVRRDEGESMGDAIDRVAGDHDDRDGHEVRGRRDRSGRLVG